MSTGGTPRPPRRSRAAAIGRLRALLERAHTPRFDMFLIAALTGAAGLLASFALLRAGLLHMGWRYLAAFAVAYAAFLGLLWLWLRWRRPDFDLPDPGRGGGDGAAPRHDDGGADGFAGEGGAFGGGGASGRFDDAPGVPAAAETGGESGGVLDGLAGIADADEAAIPVVLAGALLALLLGLLVAAAWLVLGAPSLFAELLLDAALAGGMYRRLQRLDRRHWLETALRRTAWPFGLAAALAAAGGFIVEALLPGSHTLGQAIAGLL